MAKVKDMKELDRVRVQFLGKRGAMTQFMKGMGKLSKEERPVIGKLANDVRQEIQNGLNSFKHEMETKALEARLTKERIDVTLPGKAPAIGGHHPLDIGGAGPPARALDRLAGVGDGLGQTTDRKSVV